MYLLCSGILEVQRVSERIINNIEHESIDKLRNDIEIAWKELSHFYECSEHIPVSNKSKYKHNCLFGNHRQVCVKINTITVQMFCN